MADMNRVVVIGGGPGGYEAALVAAQLGADVTVVDTDGLGGSAVLTDCVPSKTLIATAELMSDLAGAAELGLSFTDHEGDRAQSLHVDLARVNARVQQLAADQSADIERRLDREGVKVVRGRGRLDGAGDTGGVRRVAVTGDEGEQTLEADAVLIATGAAPRTLETAQPDGERILTWEQVYDLTDVPPKLIVVGSGVTGAEFASAYLAMGIAVTLVSSRDRVMPHEDPDAAMAIERVFRARGMTILNNSRAAAARRVDGGVVVELADGRAVQGSHVLMAVGSVPQTAALGLTEYGVEVAPGGYVTVDRVSRTNVPGIYAAGDCTGLLPLASVAAMQGRIAMWHALGEAVAPLKLRTVAANVFTDPELASVGITQSDIDSGRVPARSVMLPLAGNARAKMDGLDDGFVKIFCRPASGLVVGGVVVAPKASELIMPIAMAVENHLSVDQLAHTITIYPSISGSVAEAARQLMIHAED